MNVSIGALTVRHGALALAVMLALAGCDHKPPPQDQAATAQATAPVAALTSGIDLAGLDKAVQPGDDFDEYASGTWRKTAEIPADRSSTGIFLKVYI